MTKFEENGFARNFSLAAMFWTLLTAASGAAAQPQEIVYSVSPNQAWPKGTRADGKLSALSFSFGTQVSVAAVNATNKPKPPTMQDSVMTIPVGEPVALWLSTAMNKHLAYVLIEFPSASQRTQPRAPFAVRFSEVLVTSVQIVKQSGDAGPGVAEVKFKAARFEVFTATQDPAGAMKPGAQFGWDFAAQAPL